MPEGDTHRPVQREEKHFRRPNGAPFRDQDFAGGAVKRIALYARVSTKQHGQDPETQLVALRQFASHKGYIVCEEYVDHGWSGAKERRPALDRLLADTPNKKFDVVLVWRFDRFARSVKQLIFALGLFRELGIARSTVRAKHAEVAAEKARAAGGESLISAAG